VINIKLFSLNLILLSLILIHINNCTDLTSSIFRSSSTIDSLLFDDGAKAINSSDQLSLFSSNGVLEGDFSIKLKVTKLKRLGFILIGFSRNKEADSSKYFAINNRDAWGIASNGFVVEKGQWMQLPISYFTEGAEIGLTRKNDIIGISLNGVFTTYGFFFNGPVYLTVNLKNKDDSVEIIK